MIEFMEEKIQDQEQAPTAPSEFTAADADLARTVSEQPLTVAASSPTIAADSPTVGVATIAPPQGFSFQPQKHTLDLRQILVLFKTAGIDRTPRAIQRYCKLGKLDAYFHPTQHIYLATQESVEKLIASIKEIDERHNNPLFREETTGEADRKATFSEETQNGRDPSAKSREPSPSSSHEAPRTDAPSERIRQLEEKNQSLEIDKRVRDQLIAQLKNQIREDRDHFTEKLTRFARLAESFKTRLRLLAAPTQGRGARDDISDVEVVEASVMGQSEAFSDDLKTDEGKG
jgi:hypothetical protein